MSEDQTLTNIIEREQRSFRFLLMGAVFFVVLLVALGGLFFYQNFKAVDDLRELRKSVEEANANIKDVERRSRISAHRLRQDADAAAIADSRRAMESRAAFEDMRRMIEAAAPGSTTRADPAGALRAATAYLEGRRLDIIGESTINTVVSSHTASIDARTRDLLTAVVQMRRYDKNGGQLRASAPDTPAALTPELDDAASRLDRAIASPDLKQAAILGRARIDYILASANNFDRALCDAMFRHAAQIPQTAWSIQLVLNRAECRRKNGESQKAFDEFDAAVRMLSGVAADPEKALSGEKADPLLQYQAFHGRGTTRIAIAPEGAGEREAVRLAQADLIEAVRLRKLGGQSELEVAGSLENLGLAYVRAGDYKAAADNAAMVARVRVLGWNEIVRAIANGELKKPDTEQAAIRRLRDFRRAEFNECELVKLVGVRHAERVRGLMKETRSSDTAPACASPIATDEKKAAVSPS